MNALIQQAPQIEAISISSSAMLTEHTQGVWTGRKKDKRASTQVNNDNNADAGVANVYKALLGSSPDLKAVQSFAQNARNSHYSMTLPWSTGFQLLPIAQYFSYHEQMTAFQVEFYRLVDVFMQGYSWAVVQAKSKLGDFFNQNEYPTEDAIRNKFYFNVNYVPLPEAGDFRLDIGNEERATLEAHYNDYYAKQLTSAMNHLWNKVYDVLTKMSERLDYGDDEVKKVFRDSLITNVIDVVDLLTVCNVTKDSQLEKMRTDLETALRGVSASGLREDEGLRRMTKRSVDEMINSLPSLKI